MPTLSLAQIILTLWLFAAVAPAASVLLQGTLEWFAPARVETAAEYGNAGETRESSEAKCAPLVMPEVAGAGCVVASSRPLPREVRETAFGIAAPSLLHTELQRHRPRLA
jgi:hypothetical protein